MSNKKIFFLEGNEYLKNQNEDNYLLYKNLIVRSDFIDILLNFLIENYPKEEKIEDNSNKIINLFGKYNILFYDNICLIKEKLNEWKQKNNLNENFFIVSNKAEQNNKLIDNNNSGNDLLDVNNKNIEINENIGFSKIKEFYVNYCEYMKEIGNSIIEYSDNILKEIKNYEKEFDKNIEYKNLEENNKINIKEEILIQSEKKESLENIKEIKNIDEDKNINNNGLKKIIKKEDLKQEKMDNIDIENKDKNSEETNINIQNSNLENINQNIGKDKIKEDYKTNPSKEKEDSPENNLNIDEKFMEKFDDLPKINLIKTNLEIINEEVKNNNNDNLNKIEKTKEDNIETKDIIEEKDNNEEKPENIFQKEEKNININENKNENLNILKKEEVGSENNYEIKINIEEKDDENKKINVGKEEKISNCSNINDKNIQNITVKNEQLNEDIQNPVNKQIKSEIINQKNIKNNLEKIVEEIINSILKNIFSEPKFIIKSLIKEIENKVLDSIITQIFNEKIEIKDINKIEKEKDNQEKKKEEIKNEKNENKNEIEEDLIKEKGENKSLAIEEKIDEQNIKNNDLSKNENEKDKINNCDNEIIRPKSKEQIEIQENINVNVNNKENDNENYKLIKENENDSLSEKEIKNIDSLLGDISEEEEEKENIDIQNEAREKEINNEKDDNNKKGKEKKEEFYKNINLKNEETKSNEEKIREKKDNLLDKELEELDDLLNIDEMDNNEIDEEKIINEDKKNEVNDKILKLDEKSEIIAKEKKNNIECIEEKLQKEDDINKIDVKNIEQIDLKKENVNNNNENNEQQNDKNNLENKKLENKNIDKEYDFDLNEEEDIDIIIKNKRNDKEVQSNFNNKIDIIQEKKEINNINNEKIIIKNEEEHKNNNLNNIVKQDKIIENKIIENEKVNIIKQKEEKLTLPLFANLKDREVYIDSALKKMLGPISILQDEIKVLKDILHKNEESITNFFPFFLNNLKKYINKKVRFLSNFENFKVLTDIIFDIFINDKRAYIFDSIIESSKYIKYNKNYLYQFLRTKIKNFKSHIFWKALIENLLIYSLNDQVKKIIKRENKKKEEKAKAEHGQKKTSFWQDFFGSAFKDNPIVQDEEENIYLKDNENEKNSLFILELMGYTRHIKDYYKLNNTLKNELDLFSQKSLENIIYRYIKNMSYYGFNFDEMKILVIDFSAQFNFSNELKEYFINIIDCYQYKNNNILKLNLSLKIQRNKIDDNSLICVLSNIFIFLPVKERNKLLILNKKINSNKNLKRTIFYILLRQKNLSLKNRLIIWEEILNIQKYKMQYNYSEIKESTLKKIKSGELKKDTKLFNNNQTIYKDVSRTVFLVNKEQNQKKLSNILSCLNILIPSIGYYQGISYITAFIFQLLDFDEEKTFYYMLSLETQTVYKSLFLNNLELLNNNFRIFDKILEIGLPDVYFHLNKYQVKTDYFIPSWFLTIFSFVSPIFDKENIPKFCILVFEKFILDGWDSVFNAGFTALKLLNRELLKTNEFNIYNFITTDFPNKDIFKNSNFYIAEKDFIKNSGFIDNILISTINKICHYEKQFKPEDE